MAATTQHNSDAPPKTGETSKPEIPQTQRAYTLRLRGLTPDDHSWCDAVWATHEAVNNGAGVFGDWLLTLRGGLDHTLADEPRVDLQSAEGRKLVETTLKDLRKAAKSGHADPTEPDAVAEIERQRNARIRDRRILLALSWLSVESSPRHNDTREKSVVATGTIPQSERNERVTAALRDILGKRGLTDTDIQSWLAD